MHVIAVKTQSSPPFMLNISMNLSSSLYILLLGSIYLGVEAQIPEKDIPSPVIIPSHQPDTAVILGVIAIMMALAFFLVFYARSSYMSARFAMNNRIQDVEDGLGAPFSGVDKAVIESLPFFKFSYLKGSREGLECSICLSKFEDIEVLRLLPKCKHAFHINCLDKWLEKHSSCPLCRSKISLDDLSGLTQSNSWRFLWNNKSELLEESQIELYVEREDNPHKRKRQKEFLTQDENQKALHKFNHKILMSDIFLKNRWSNLTSSDLMFLQSEMLHDISSHRFLALEEDHTKNSIATTVPGNVETKNIKEEMGRRRKELEDKLNKFKQSNLLPPLGDVQQGGVLSEDTKGNGYSKMLSRNEKRSMSEIVLYPRFEEVEGKSIDGRGPSLLQQEEEDERRRTIWLPIARRTVQLFANRERS